MKPIIVAVALTLALALTGCAGTKRVLVTEYKYVVPEIPVEFSKDCNNANLLDAYPETPVTLGSEAATIAVDFYKTAKICQLGSQATTEFYAKAKIVIEEGGDPKTIQAKLSALVKNVKEKYWPSKP